MSTGTGLDAAVGIAKESTFGTYVAPTQFVPFSTEGFQLQPTYLESTAIRRGRLTQRDSLHKQTTRAVTGSISSELFDEGMDKFFDALNGGTTPTPALEGGSTGAYRTTHNIGLNGDPGKSHSVQVIRPAVDGTDYPFSYVGCKVPSATFSFTAGGLATFTCNFDGVDEDTSEPAGSYVDPDVAPYSFDEIDVSISSGTLGCVRSLTINIERPMASDRYCLGSGGTKKEQLQNGYYNISADAELEFGSMSDHDRFRNEDVVGITVTGTGREVEAGFNHEISFELTATKQTSSAPTVGGPDIVTASAAFKGLDNGTDVPLVIETVTGSNAV